MKATVFIEGNRLGKAHRFVENLVTELSAEKQKVKDLEALVKSLCIKNGGGVNLEVSPLTVLDEYHLYGLNKRYWVELKASSLVNKQ